MTTVSKQTLFIFAILLWPSLLFSLSASWVDFEFRDDGKFRVKVVYTVPELKEVREVWVDFKEKTKAEAYYFDLAKGADFYLPESESRKFENSPKLKPNPW